MSALPNKVALTGAGSGIGYYTVGLPGMAAYAASKIGFCIRCIERHHRLGAAG